MRLHLSLSGLAVSVCDFDAVCCLLFAACRVTNCMKHDAINSWYRLAGIHSSIAHLT